MLDLVVESKCCSLTSPESPPGKRRLRRQQCTSLLIYTTGVCFVRCTAYRSHKPNCTYNLVLSLGIALWKRKRCNTSELHGVTAVQRRSSIKLCPVDHIRTLCFSHRHVSAATSRWPRCCCKIFCGGQNN